MVRILLRCLHLAYLPVQQVLRVLLDPQVLPVLQDPVVILDLKEVQVRLDQQDPQVLLVRQQVLIHPLPLLVQ